MQTPRWEACEQEWLGWPKKLRQRRKWWPLFCSKRCEKKLNLELIFVCNLENYLQDNIFESELATTHDDWIGNPSFDILYPHTSNHLLPRVSHFILSHPVKFINQITDTSETRIRIEIQKQIWNLGIINTNDVKMNNTAVLFQPYHSKAITWNEGYVQTSSSPAL